MVDLVEKDMAVAADAVVDGETMSIIIIEDILNSPFIEIDTGLTQEERDPE